MKSLVRLAVTATLVTLTVVLASCGTAASTGSAGASSPSIASPATSLGAPTSGRSAAASAAASPSSNLVLPHDDPALEAQLPAEFEGKTLFKISVGPVSSVGNAGAEPVKALVDEIGDGTGNFSLAFANDPTSPTFSYFALRIPGAESAQLVERYGALKLADARGAESEHVMLGGKSVTHITAPGNPIGDDWFYAIGDTLFGVQAGSPEQAEALIALLP
jgi:hypothetical protein